MKFTLGLRTGGLQEDPGWHVEQILDIEAPSLEDAKNEWAKQTGEDKKDTWDPVRQTVWGWNIVEIK